MKQLLKKQVEKWVSYLQIQIIWKTGKKDIRLRFEYGYSR